MGFLLVVARGRSKSSAHRLGAGVTVIGRQDGCQLQIRSSQVSRRHCELSEKDGQLLVKDLGSSNGTLVNGERVETRVLQPGDELTIGNVSFRIERADVAGPARKVAEPAAAGAVSVSEELPSGEVIPLDDDEATIHIAAPPKPQPTAGAVPAARQATPAPAAGPVDVEPEAAGGPELGEDAVADFLLNIELDEDDKV